MYDDDSQLMVKLCQRAVASKPGMLAHGNGKNPTFVTKFRHRHEHHPVDHRSRFHWRRRLSKPVCCNPNNDGIRSNGEHMDFDPDFRPKREIVPRRISDIS